MFLSSKTLKTIPEPLLCTRQGTQHFFCHLPFFFRLAIHSYAHALSSGWWTRTACICRGPLAFPLLVRFGQGEILA